MELIKEKKNTIKEDLIFSPILIKSNELEDLYFDKSIKTDDIEEFLDNLINVDTNILSIRNHTRLLNVIRKWKTLLHMLSGKVYKKSIKQSTLNDIIKQYSDDFFEENKDLRKALLPKI